MNTSAENFLWEENAGFILVNKGGFYEVSFAFFSVNKLNVQLMVNGEVASSTVNNSAYTILNNTGKLKNNKITGISAHEYLNLTNRSRISIGLNGDSGEGFLSIRKIG